MKNNKILVKLENKKIAVLGLGIENQALVKFFLKKKIKSEVTICDARNQAQLGDKFKEFAKHKNIHWRLGAEFNQRLFEFDVLFRSPGWPLACPGIREAITNYELRITNQGKDKDRVISEFIYSPMRLFLDICPTRNVIGVTGTKGKGTTSSLIYAILKKAGKRVWLGGNIGVAPFSFIDQIKPTDWVVLELSSFQLEDFQRSPKIAVITNFSREHLAPADPVNPNYHRSLKAYWEAKVNLFRWQKAGDYLVINDKLNYKLSFDKAQDRRITNLPLRQINYKLGKSKVVYFGKSDLQSRLLGEHNKENIAAAVAVAGILQIKPAIAANAVAQFRGLEHRIELVAEKAGVKYYDDSFATTPEAAITALRSFSAPIVLLAGGADKGADFRQFAREIKKRAKFVILFAGEATPRLKKDILAAGYSRRQIAVVDSMEEAVAKAVSSAQSGDVVLLSTGCASFGMFANYKERGRLFQLKIKN